MEGKPDERSEWQPETKKKPEKSEDEDDVLNEKTNESERKSDIKKTDDNKWDKPEKEESGTGKNDETTTKPSKAGRHLAIM